MIKYKYKSSNIFKYTSQLSFNSTLQVNKLNYTELIRIPTYLTLIETQKQRLPPVDYICFRCGKPNHFIQDCPTNENELYEIKIHKPTGIPKEFLQVSSNITDNNGSKNIMITSKGELVQTTARTSEWDQISPKDINIPDEFICNICFNIMYMPHKIDDTLCCLKCLDIIDGAIFDEELHYKIIIFIEGDIL